MNHEIRHWSGANCVAIEHRGAYNKIGAAFGKLCETTVAAQIPIGVTLGIYQDDPSEVDEQSLRSYACAVLPPDVTVSHPDLVDMNIPPCECLVVTHVGSYEGLGDSWNKAYTMYLPQSGRVAAQRSPWEVYVDDCTVVPESELRTEIWVPLV